MNKLKFFTLITVFAVAAFLILPRAQTGLAAAPGNDDFYTATVVPDLPFSDSIDTTEATIGANDPSPCGYFPYASVWYAFTPAEGMGIDISTNGSSYSNAVGVYTGDYATGLYQVVCAVDTDLSISLTTGNTYFIEIVDIGYGVGGTLQLSLTQILPPANDNFANATIINNLSFQDSVDNTGATIESDEPNPGCLWGNMINTIWYQYTPVVSGSITAEKSGISTSFMAIYTGSNLSDLSLMNCSAWGWNYSTITVEAGVTYYFQLGSFDYYWPNTGNLQLNVYTTPPPAANFWWNPSEPNKFDTVQFCDNSYDPVGAGFNQFWWDFGDGGYEGPSSSWCAYHLYGVDGDYTVTHSVTTTDGRSAEVTKIVTVRTHDVAITKFTVPQSAVTGQTRTITVGIRNSLYPETVTVELYKSTPSGYSYVGSLTQYVPVRPANRTTDFRFNYTFTPEDAQIGKVTFKAVANLNSARDALPADNEAISLPTRVTGSTTAASDDNPPAASTFGLAGASLTFGAILANSRSKKWTGNQETGEL